MKRLRIVRHVHRSMLVQLALAGVLAVGFCAKAAAEEMVQNGSFEEANAGIPLWWTVEEGASSRGSIGVVDRQFTAGAVSLLLQPNEWNADVDGSRLALTQRIAAEPLRGRRVTISGTLAAEDGAEAVLAVFFVGDDGRVAAVTELRESKSRVPLLRRNVIAVPDDPRITELMIVCGVHGTAGSAYFDSISLMEIGAAAIWPQALGIADERPDLRAEIHVYPRNTLRYIPRTIYGQNLEWIWNGNGIWDAEAGQPHAGLLYLARELASPLYRFPGGIMSDYYDWRAGVGPPRLRPALISMPGGAISRPTFGTDEALRFTADAGARLLLTVNAGTGTPDLAAEWVRYVNSGGELRVEYWEVGNELYVADGSPHAMPITVPPAVYAFRFLEFARAMKAVDPRIKVGAIVPTHYSRRAPNPYPDWTDVLLKTAGPEIDFLSVHNGYAPALADDEMPEVRTMYSALLAAPQLIRDSLQSLSARIDSLEEPHRSRIRIAVTEWGPWFRARSEGHYADHGKTLGSAVFVASTLKTFIEDPRVDIANAFHFVDGLHLGWIGWRDQVPVPKPSWLAMLLFTRRFGSTLVESRTESALYDSPSAGLVDAVTGVPYIEAVSSLDPDGTLYVIVINKHLDSAIPAEIILNDSPASGEATTWTLQGATPEATTGTYPLGSTKADDWMHAAGEAHIVQATTELHDGRIRHEFPPASVTSFVIRLTDEQ